MVSRRRNGQDRVSGLRDVWFGCFRGLWSARADAGCVVPGRGVIPAGRSWPRVWQPHRGGGGDVGERLAGLYLKSDSRKRSLAQEGGNEGGRRPMQSDSGVSQGPLGQGVSACTCRADVTAASLQTPETW